MIVHEADIALARWAGPSRSRTPDGIGLCGPSRWEVEWISCLVCGFEVRRGHSTSMLTALELHGAHYGHGEGRHAPPGRQRRNRDGVGSYPDRVLARCVYCCRNTYGLDNGGRPCCAACWEDGADGFRAGGAW